MDKIDLHVHTTASDGTMRPRDVTSLAAMLGLKAIAITDHDSVSGIDEAGEAGALLGVSIIPGIEISAEYKGKEVHVLGYFLDHTSPKLREYMNWVHAQREIRLRAMAEKLQKKGFDVDYDEIAKAHPGATPGRPHLAQRLIELGVVSSVNEAFRRYLDKGRSCYVPRNYISLADAAKLIHSCGGICVLAHPLQYGFDRAELDSLAKSAADLGFKGMEIHYSGYTQKDMDKLYTLAEKYTLLPTGGSDFHGENKPEAKLGEPTVPAYFLMMLAKSQFM